MEKQDKLKKIVKRAVNARWYPKHTYLYASGNFWSITEETYRVCRRDVIRHIIEAYRGSSEPNLRQTIETAFDNLSCYR